MTLEPTWQGIPSEIKKEVVKNLDYKSRFRLAMCSKTDKSLIENCPIFLEQVEMYAFPYDHLKSYPKVLYIKDQSGIVEVRENIVDHFFKTFQHKQSTVESVIFGFKSPESDSTGLVREMLLKIRQEPLKIKAKAVNIDARGFLDTDLLTMYQLFDGAHLNSIIFQRTLTKDVLAELGESKGWKNARQIVCYGRQEEVAVDTVLNLDKLRIFSIRLTPEDVLRVISSFINRMDLEAGFGFRLSYGMGSKERQIVLKFENLPNKVIVLNERQQPSYHFNIKLKDHVLVLRFFSFDSMHNVVEGYICSVEHPDEDFDQFRAWNPPDQWQYLRRLNDRK